MARVEPKVDTAITFAKHTVNTMYEDLPAEAVEVTKRHILDQLATTIGGSTQPGCVELVELIKEWGGKEESTILAYGCKVPALNAAQANATMGHALDYDDCDDRTGEHAGDAVISAGLAMAERKGRVSGKEFLTAVAVGTDISYRLARTHKPKKVDVYTDGWMNSQLYGYIGAPATAGKILGLNEEQMINAFGIAYQEAGGNVQCVIDGALTKRMGPSFAARAGIFSTLLAQKGIRGVQNTLEGPAGMFNTYLFGNYDPEVLTADLGKKFMGVEAGFKPYPSCRMNHPFNDATLALVKEHSIKPEDVAEVTLITGKTGCGNCEPIEIKRTPRTIVDAQFSIPWNVAVALVYGKVLIKDFTPEAIKDTTVLQMTQKISCRLDESLTRRSAIEPGIVEIKTKDMRILSKRVDCAYGNPQNPMGWEAFADKLRDCASWMAKPIPRENLGKVVEMAKRLEELDDVSSIIQLLS